MRDETQSQLLVQRRVQQPLLVQLHELHLLLHTHHVRGSVF